MQDKPVPIGVRSTKTKTKADIKHGHRWGSWQFDEKRLYLDHIAQDYNIPLLPDNLVVQIFSWIQQIKAKSWGSPQDLHDLLQAYAVIFESNRKFQGAFKKEIVTRRDRWKAFCEDSAALIRQASLGTSEWNNRLEEIYKRFCGGTSGA